MPLSPVKMLAKREVSLAIIKAYWPNLVIAVSSIRRSVRRALLGWESELLQRVADPSLM